MQRRAWDFWAAVAREGEGTGGGAVPASTAPAAAVPGGAAPQAGASPSPAAGGPAAAGSAGQNGGAATGAPAAPAAPQPATPPGGAPPWWTQRLGQVTAQKKNYEAMLRANGIDPATGQRAVPQGAPQGYAPQPQPMAQPVMPPQAPYYPQGYGAPQPPQPPQPYGVPPQGYAPPPLPYGQQPPPGYGAPQPYNPNAPRMYSPEEFQQEAARVAEENDYNSRANAAVSAGRQEYGGDFDAALALFQSLGPDNQIPRDVVDAMLETGSAHRVAYALGKNPEEAIRLLNMPAGPRRAAAVTKFALTMGQAGNRVSGAPAPIVPQVGSGGAGEIDPSKMSTAEFMKWREKNATF